MTQIVEANTILSAAFPELILDWIPASAGTTGLFCDISILIRQ
jgi:hypothetical protein